MFAIGGINLAMTTGFAGRAVVVGVAVPPVEREELEGGDLVERTLDRRETEELRDALTDILERW